MKKFKFNWGHGVILALGSFMIFILTLVFSKDFKGSSFDLVADNYYEKEINYQEEIDAINNVNNLLEKPKVTIESYGILMIFPEEFDNKNTEGRIHLYRPSSKELDQNRELKISADHKFVIPKDGLVDGIYELNVYWTKSDKNYQMKTNIQWKQQ